MSASLILAVLMIAPGCSGSQSGTQHYVYFNRDRDRIHEQSFLDTDAFVGAQLKYAWKELEPEKDVYALDVIEKDLEFLARHGKKLFIQLQDVSFDTMYVNVPRYLRTSPEYNGGVALQYEYAGEDESEWPQEGFVARWWDGEPGLPYTNVLTMADTPRIM